MGWKNLVWRDSVSCRRPKSEKDFALLESKFYANTPKPVAKSAWEVFATFTVGLRGRSIEIEFVEEGELHGLTPNGSRVTRREAQLFVSDLVFTPPAEMIKKVVVCRPTSRVAYYLHNGLQVVDDMRQELAVHIMRDELLALNLVQRFITVRNAKRDCDYVARVPHKDLWKQKVMEVIHA